MNTKSLSILALPLTLPLLATACGDAQTVTEDGLSSDRIAVDSLEISSEGAVYVNHPMRVAVSGTTAGESYRTDLLVGLRTLDGNAGCVLGAMPAEHDAANGEGEPAPFSQEMEFVVSSECAQLAGRDDVELFASFDPWNRLGERDDLGDLAGAGEAGLELYDIVAASALSAEGCESCETVYAVHENPGYDARLDSLELDSVVAVLPVADEDGNAPELGNQPHFSVSAQSRVTGLAQGQSLLDGLVNIEYRIRPLGSSEDGLPLTRIEDLSQGRELAVPTAAAVPVESHGAVATTDALFIEGQAREAITEGAWSKLTDFEVVTCLGTEFDQAVYAAEGETEARANDCGAIPVVVARQTIEDSEALLAGAATKSRPADVWQQTWSAGSGYNFGESNLTFKAWVESTSADGPTTTEKGISVHSAGSWFEAGVYSNAKVFGTDVTLVDIYGTFLAYDWGGGGVAMGAYVLFNQIVPDFEIQIADGVPVTLQQMLDLAGVQSELAVSKSFNLAGVNFDDGCGSVSAGLWVEGTLGVNTEATSITPFVTERGVKLQGVFQPYINLAAKAGATVHYSEFIGGGIVATLDLIDVQMPFTATAEFQDYEALDAQRLYFTQDVGAQISTLSGNIKFQIWYKIPWPLCWSNCTKDHHHTIASWNGLSTYVNFFSANQVMTIGSERPGAQWCWVHDETLYEGDFNGDGKQDWMCHVPGNRWKYIDFNDGSNNFAGTDYVSQHYWCGGDQKLMVGDFNGDGRDDLLCHDAGNKYIDFADQNGHFNGTDFHLSIDWCSHAGASIQIDDYNGDGRDDILCRDQNDNVWYDYTDQNGHLGGTDFHSPTGDSQFKRTKIRNRWYGGEYINKENGLATSVPTNTVVGSAGYESRDWIFERVSGTQYYKIRNASDGSYLHRENGPLVADHGFNGHSGQWSLVAVPGMQKHYRIINRWTGEALHREYGSLAVGHVSAGAWSSQWELDGSFFL
ncbi:putative secreted esterase [Plesiocystis pacifica SIR-1]|uniref:Putative secreted esterase n=1 Tax=Plesiocystis pacifica SIR-1 TaxID=391625 RepID=A6G3V5_9BACT|nr:FG-GAP-like repeat-containing protein [Plesiocystis pacifica]EDM79492.1 putative secreted esterase [Plesiocystis pacifica SIR-1]